jgi:hypothetical protein
MTTTTLHCEMKRECIQPVTYLDEKGYIYCTFHGQLRQGWCRCRKLRPHELRKLERGEPVARY